MLNDEAKKKEVKDEKMAEGARCSLSRLKMKRDYHVDEAFFSRVRLKSSKKIKKK